MRNINESRSESVNDDRLTLAMKRNRDRGCENSLSQLSSLELARLGFPNGHNALQFEGHAIAALPEFQSHGFSRVLHQAHYKPGLGDWQRLG